MESINTNMKLPNKAQGLNPKQKAGIEELINCLEHILNLRTTAGSFGKVAGPELASILYCTSNMGGPLCLEILNLTETFVFF